MMLFKINIRFYCHCCCFLLFQTLLLSNELRRTKTVASAFISNNAAAATSRVINNQRNTYILAARRSTARVDDFVELLEGAEVGQDILDEMTMIQEGDEAIVELPVMFAGENDDDNDYTHFDFERWMLHRSPQRYFRLLLGIFSGVTTRRIFPTVLFLVLWSAVIDFYNSIEKVYGLPELVLPITPFELAVPVLGLLLVFRSNTSYERFVLGSDSTWEITCRFRSVIRQLLSFSIVPGRFSSKERSAAYELVDACIVLHSWILTDYLRPPPRSSSNTRQNEKISNAKQAKIIQKALVLNYVDQEELLTSTKTVPANRGNSINGDGGEEMLPIRYQRQRLQQTPSGLISTVTMGIISRMPSLDPQETVMMEEQFSQIMLSLGICETLIRTPIPLGYTRYSVRFLMIWLTLLPLALVQSFCGLPGFKIDTWWDGAQFSPNMVISMLFLSVAFLSIEDISVQLEEPFSILPLDLHTKWLKKDYTQMKKTSRLLDQIKANNSNNDNVERIISINNIVANK